MRLSYSRLKTYSDCPRKELFRYRLGFASESAFSLDYGHLTHLLLEDTANGGKTLAGIDAEDKHKDPKSLIYIDPITRTASLTPTPNSKAISMGRYPNMKPQEAVDLINSEVSKATKRFEKAPEGYEVYPEFYFEEIMGDDIFVGYIDLLMFDKNGTAYIIDYKTGKTKPTRLQLEVYSYFVAKMDETIENIEASYYFTNSDEFQRFSYTRAEALAFGNRISSKIETISKQTDINVFARNSYKCNWCDYRNECNKYSTFNDIYSQSRKTSSREETPIFGSYLSENVILFDGSNETSRAKAVELHSLAGGRAFAIDATYSDGDNRSLIDRYISLAPKIANISFLDDKSKQTLLSMPYKEGDSFKVDDILFSDL